MSFILPKDNPYLIGHEKAEMMFLDSFKKGTLHHALLISGIKGIGKATFAYKIARFLLQENPNKFLAEKLDVSPSDPVFKQISGASNPNFLAIERDYTETDKKKIIKAIKDGEPLDDDDLLNLKKSAVIKVDEVRQINQFLSKTSFDGAWRVVIVDSIDELNAAGANAILKILEEPPAKTILLLISHQPSKLLPTIKSRCAKMTLESLSENNVASLIRRYAPEVSEANVALLSKISSGSIGRALNYVLYDGLEIYQKLQNIVYAGERFDLNTALGVASIAASDENVWYLTIELLLKMLSDMASAGQKMEEIYSLYALISKLSDEVFGLNMDKKQALLNVFYQISKVVNDVC